jgi:membrane protease YdiL (CAAX protease family)
MSDPHNNPPLTAKSPAPKTWDFMETTFVALIAYAVFALTGGIGALFILLVTQDGLQVDSAQIDELMTQGRWVGAALITGCLPTLAVLWIAIRKAGREFAEYLALNWPSIKELLLALAVTAAVIAAHMMFWPYRPSAYSLLVVGGPGGLFVLLIGGCFAGPIVEEFVFRGFMFRGWSESFLGPIGAIVLTSAFFAMSHAQYNWAERFWIFLFGLVLCTFRWRANSTWLTVVVHSTANTFIFFILGPYA